MDMQYTPTNVQCTPTYQTTKFNLKSSTVFASTFILHMSSSVSEGKVFTPLFPIKIGGFRGRKTANKQRKIFDSSFEVYCQYLYHSG